MACKQLERFKKLGGNMDSNNGIFENFDVLSIDVSDNVGFFL